MNDEPVVWHYDLIAERWAEFVTGVPEVPFFLQKMANYGQPVLDVAFGVGRALLSLLQAGIDVDGCAISSDMLYYWRSKAAGEGFDPNLYASSQIQNDPHRNPIGGGLE